MLIFWFRSKRQRKGCSRTDPIFAYKTTGDNRAVGQPGFEWPFCSTFGLLSARKNPRENGLRMQAKSCIALFRLQNKSNQRAVGQPGFEPGTSAMSRRRHNHLDHWPFVYGLLMVGPLVITSDSCFPPSCAVRGLDHWPLAYAPCVVIAFASYFSFA